MNCVSRGVFDATLIGILIEILIVCCGFEIEMSCAFWSRNDGDGGTLIVTAIGWKVEIILLLNFQRFSHTQSLPSTP